MCLILYVKHFYTMRIRYRLLKCDIFCIIIFLYDNHEIPVSSVSEQLVLNLRLKLKVTQPATLVVSAVPRVSN